MGYNTVYHRSESASRDKNTFVGLSEFNPFGMAIIETTVPLGEVDGSTATASKKSYAHKDRNNGISLGAVTRRFAFIFKIMVASLVLAVLFALLLIGSRDRIVWKQLVGSFGVMSGVVWWWAPAASPDNPFVTPATFDQMRQMATDDSQLHRLGMLVIKGVMVVVSVFINMLFGALAFRMGDYGSGYLLVTLLLPCLQFFVGIWILGDLAHGWVRKVSLGFYIFGISAIFAGSWGFFFLVNLRLTGNYFLAVWYSSYYLVGPTDIFASKILNWWYPASNKMLLVNLEEQEERRDHIQLEEWYLFGNFRYIQKY